MHRMSPLLELLFINFTLGKVAHLLLYYKSLPLLIHINSHTVLLCKYHKYRLSTSRKTNKPSLASLFQLVIFVYPFMAMSN